MNLRMLSWVACRLAMVLGVTCFGVAAAAGAAPTSVIVFGDSLSDMGNVADASFGIIPGSAYYGDRFANGPVWVERLSSDLGLAPLRPSTSGGNNFAYGGALTAGTGVFEGLVVQDVDDQVTDYLGSRVADPKALYVLFAGANDLFGGQTNVNVPTHQIATDLERLFAAGARQFLVPNLPQLGKIPKNNGDATNADRFNRLTDQYNAAFEATIEGLAVKHLDATYYRLDVAEIFAAAIDHPADWGLTNVTNPAAPGLDPGDLFYNRKRIVAHPEQYLFWDTIHPTATIHAILGDYANALLTGLPGDFDTDGEVDGADLKLLQTGFGASSAVRRQGDADGDGDVDGGDFLVWQRQRGANILSQLTHVGASAVPEPSSALLLLMGAFGVCRARPKP